MGVGGNEGFANDVNDANDATPCQRLTRSFFFLLLFLLKKKEIYLYIFRQRNRNKKAPAVDGLMRSSFAFLPVNANGPCLWLSPSAGPRGTIETQKGSPSEGRQLDRGAGWGPWIKNKKNAFISKKKEACYSPRGSLKGIKDRD